jgi:hypothetical protein
VASDDFWPGPAYANVSCSAGHHDRQIPGKEIESGKTAIDPKLPVTLLDPLA